MDIRKRGKRESDVIFRKSYEEKSIEIERKINRIRFFFISLFLLISFSSYKSGSTKPVYITMFLF